MAALAQRLPVVAIPKQSLIALMGRDMVNYRCRYGLAFLEAVSTQRIVP
jgi:hypothetical protein